MAKPLTWILQKTVCLMWSDKEHHCFTDLWDHLGFAPAFAYLDFSPATRNLFWTRMPATMPWALCCAGVRATASRTSLLFICGLLSAPDRVYYNTRIDMLVIAYTVRIFPLCAGERLLIRKDRKSLMWLHSTCDPEGQVTRLQML